jgi:hypothetical protein
LGISIDEMNRRSKRARACPSIDGKYIGLIHSELPTIARIGSIRMIKPGALEFANKLTSSALTHSSLITSSVSCRELSSLSTIIAYRLLIPTCSLPSTAVPRVIIAHEAKKNEPSWESSIGPDPRGRFILHKPLHPSSFIAGIRRHPTGM